MPVTPTHTQASGYGPHSQPNSWGQSQPTCVNPGPTLCYGRIIGAEQPQVFRGPANRPSARHGYPRPSWPRQRNGGFVTTTRSEQSDHFTITSVVSVRIPPSIRFGRPDGDTYASRPNLRRSSKIARLDRNDRTP
ncbi:unnamed protein product [Prunus brigantina]